MRTSRPANGVATQRSASRCWSSLLVSVAAVTLLTPSASADTQVAQIFPAAEFSFDLSTSVALPIVELVSDAVPNRPFVIPVTIGTGAELSGTVTCMFVGPGTIVIRDGALPPGSDVVHTSSIECDPGEAASSPEPVQLGEVLIQQGEEPPVVSIRGLIVSAVVLSGGSSVFTEQTRNNATGIVRVTTTAQDSTREDVYDSSGVCTTFASSTSVNGAPPTMRVFQPDCDPVSLFVIELKDFAELSGTRQSEVLYQTGTYAGLFSSLDDAAISPLTGTFDATVQFVIPVGHQVEAVRVVAEEATSAVEFSQAATWTFSGAPSFDPPFTLSVFNDALNGPFAH